MRLWRSFLYHFLSPHHLGEQFEAEGWHAGDEWVEDWKLFTFLRSLSTWLQRECIMLSSAFKIFHFLISSITIMMTYIILYVLYGHGEWGWFRAIHIHIYHARLVKENSDFSFPHSWIQIIIYFSLSPAAMPSSSFHFKWKITRNAS